MIERPKDNHILHAKLVIKRKCDEKGIITKYNIQKLMCGIQEHQF